MSRWSRRCGPSHIRTGSLFPRHRLKNSPDVFCQNLLASGIRVKAIRQTQGRITAHAFQKIRHQSSVVFCREIDIHLSERADVVIRGIVRQLHPGNDDAGVRIALLHPIDDLLEILPNLFNRNSKEGVVYSQL